MARYGVAAFAAEWRRAAWVTRYLLSAHLLANILVMAAAAASVGGGLVGHQHLQMGALAVAALCAVQAASTWSALQRRLGARYSLW